MRLQEFTASVDSNLYHWLGIVDKCLGNKYDWNKVKFDSDMLCKKLNQHLGYPITQRIVRDSGMDQFQAFLEEEKEYEILRILKVLRESVGLRKLDNSGIRIVLFWIFANINLFREKQSETSFSEKNVQIY